MDMTSGECEDSTELLALSLIIINIFQTIHLGKTNLCRILKCKMKTYPLQLKLKHVIFWQLCKEVYSFLTKAVWKNNFNPV